MSEIAVLVLLDACRPDYLERTRYLKSLARRSGVGEMEEPFGFLPRASYFGGLRPDDVGYSNMFALDPVNSPFPCLPEIDRLEQFGLGGTARSWLEQEGRAKVGDFGARYLETFSLPLSEVGSYTLSETEAPWSQLCGYRSLFHILDEHGIEWEQCSWPYTREVALADPGIVGQLLSQLTSTTRFAFLHLSQLDADGHMYGPGSRALQNSLDSTDELCEHLMNSLRERYDRVRVLFFGDHGMVRVIRTVDLSNELAKLEYRFRGQYRIFTDSPMARFWFDSEEAKEEVTSILKTLDCGEILMEQDLLMYNASKMCRENGELFFMAHPGIVFSPNAFQGEKIEVKGMHGYLPSLPDNRGLLVLHDTASRVRGSLGVAKSWQLFPTCLEMCDLEVSDYTTSEPLRIQCRTENWTVGGNEIHEKSVDSDLKLGTRILSSLSPASTIAVSGSFGRGEGGVLDSEKKPQVLNDYDYTVIGYDAANSLEAAKRIKGELGTDFIDVLALTSLQDLKASQLNYDLRNGSRVLSGDPLALERIPKFPPEDIPLSSACLLLVNRICGLMLVPFTEQSGKDDLSQFAMNQIIKAYTAIGDAYLIRWNDYSTRYSVRGKRFSALAPALNINENLRERIKNAYSYKIEPTKRSSILGVRDFKLIRKAMRNAFEMLDGKGAWHEAISMGLDEVVAPVADVVEDNSLAFEKLKTLGLCPSSVSSGESRAVFRRAIYEGVLAMFFGTGEEKDSNGWGQALKVSLNQIGVSAIQEKENWPDEETRRALASAWLNILSWVVFRKDDYIYFGLYLWR